MGPQPKLGNAHTDTQVEVKMSASEAPLAERLAGPEADTSAADEKAGLLSGPASSTLDVDDPKTSSFKDKPPSEVEQCVASSVCFLILVGIIWAIVAAVLSKHRQHDDGAAVACSPSAAGCFAPSPSPYPSFPHAPHSGGSSSTTNINININFGINGVGLGGRSSRDTNADGNDSNDPAKTNTHDGDSSSGGSTAGGDFHSTTTMGGDSSNESGSSGNGSAGGGSGSSSSSGSGSASHGSTGGSSSGSSSWGGGRRGRG